ncbi:unnamed protein product [Psylliodes chrysocephalus]|uniref:Lipocalin/cytosolic fatty-acid binding domain-containing protein n=1 Tax=Psylliodes chrysocephalus TaxID=3402493 RepID=A0A9P0CSU1_9CUCU|nr:unnamed protein product [Psylliodes chrysocephala]
MFRAYLFFSFVVLVSAQIPSLGFCPDYLPMTDFDIDSFLGKWYESERYFQFSDIASRCVVTDYAKGPSGKIYVSNEVTSRLTGVKRVIDGHLELSGRVGEGKLNVKYSTTPLSSQAILTVLDTDYDNYAVIWSCSGFGPLSAQSAWVMTRERLPSGPVLQKVYGVLDKFKISRTFFVRTDQEGCALAASEINAANGITGQSTIPQATGQPQRILPLLGATGDAQQVYEPSEAVKSEKIPDAVNSESAGIQEILPKAVNANSMNHEPTRSKFVNSIAAVAADAVSEAVNADSMNHEPTSPKFVNSIAAVAADAVSEAVNADSMNHEPTSPKFVNSIAAIAADAVSEAVKSVASSSEAVQTDIKKKVINPMLVRPQPENELNPLHVAEVILENNSLQQTEPQLKSEIKLVPKIPQLAEDVYVPIKTPVEQKVTITKTKTN